MQPTRRDVLKLAATVPIASLVPPLVPQPVDSEPSYFDLLVRAYQQACPFPCRVWLRGGGSWCQLLAEVEEAPPQLSMVKLTDTNLIYRDGDSWYSGTANHVRCEFMFFQRLWDLNKQHAYAVLEEVARQDWNRATVFRSWFE